MEYASKGVANAGLTTGIIGTAFGAMNSGLLPNLFGGGNCGCSENMAVNRYELSMQNELTNKDMEIAYLKGREESKSDALEMYKYIDSQIRRIDNELAEQRVYNATLNSTVGCISGQVAALMSLTKMVIPNGSVCPGWGNVTVAPATTTAG